MKKTEHRAFVHLILNANGWKYDPRDLTAQNIDGYVSWKKEGCIGVDVHRDNDEMVLIDDSGDFLHEQINYYTLVGLLIHYRQIPYNFIGK